MKSQGFVESEIELERDIQTDLVEWKNKRHRTVLQVEGPRLVGKTHEVKKFAYSHYQQVIYVNLVRDDYGFEDLMNQEAFMEHYCHRTGIGEFLDNEDTILVIDEIQESRAVYNAIRDLRERLFCDIIVSGSYLACTVKSRDFFLPAGIAYLKIYPLSFNEFCRAMGMEMCLEKLNLYGGSVPDDYRMLEDAYRTYRYIGGYPQVVTTYLKTGNQSDCMDVLGDLVQTFIAESSRFFSNRSAPDIFREVFRAILVDREQEKKGTGKSFLESATNFVKDSVKEPVSCNEVRAVFSWLLYSGIIGSCDLYNNGDVTDVVSNRRAYFADNGIANYISGNVTIPRATVEGILTETFVFTELNRLYQMPAGRKRILGDNRARSLEFYKEKGMIDQAFRAMPSKGGHGEKFDTIPVYAVGSRFPYEE